MPEFQPSAEQIARADYSFRQWKDDAEHRRICRASPGYHPQIKQLIAEEMLVGPQHNMMLVGGARSGKTFQLVKHLAGRALRAAGKSDGAARQAILRLHLKDVGESIGMDTFPKVMKLRYPDARWRHHNKSQGGVIQFVDKTLPHSDWSELWLMGLDDQDRADKILGKEFFSLYYNECSQLSYGSVLTGVSRLAQKIPGFRNRVYYDLNPVGTGHFSYSLFIEGRKPGQIEALRDPSDYVYMYMNPMDNAENVAEGYIQMLMDYPEIKRRRFFDGKYVAQLEGALWTLEMLENLRLQPGDTLIPQFERIVVAVDPSGCRGADDTESHQIGIVAAALGVNGHVYLLSDLSGWYSPEQWGRAVVVEHFARQADRVVGERNFGGDMVRAIIQGCRIDGVHVGQNVPYKEVNASVGKHVRAEPIAAMYERKMVHHVGGGAFSNDFALLERELINFTTQGYKGAGSPNRADALVWAATELFGNTLSYGLTTYLSGEQDKLDAEREARMKATSERLKASIQGGVLAKIETVPDDGKEPTAGCPDCGSKVIQQVASGGNRCGACGNQWDTRTPVEMSAITGNTRATLKK